MVSGAGKGFSGSATSARPSVRALFLLCHFRCAGFSPLDRKAAARAPALRFPSAVSRQDAGRSGWREFPHKPFFFRERGKLPHVMWKSSFQGRLGGRAVGFVRLWGGAWAREKRTAASEAASSALGLCLRASRARTGVATASRGFSRSSQPRPPRRPALRATLPRGHVPRGPGLPGVLRASPPWSRVVFSHFCDSRSVLCFLTSRCARSLAASLPFPCFFSFHRGFLVARLCL